VPVEGLKIRRAEPDDYLDLYEMFHGPKLYTGTMQLPYPSREQWRKRLASEEASGYYNLVAVVEDRVIGMVTVETFPNKPRRRHVGRIGISVDDDWQGKGVGTAMMAAAIDLADNCSTSHDSSLKCTWITKRGFICMSASDLSSKGRCDSTRSAMEFTSIQI